MKLKRVGLIIATSVSICMGSIMSYANEPVSNLGVAGTADNQTAYNLITNYSNKLRQVGKFKATEFISMGMNFNDGVSNESMSSEFNRISTVDGDKVHTTVKSVSYDNGVKGDEDYSEGYSYRSGDVSKNFEITPTEVVKSETAFTDPVDGYFPIKYHGNETVALVNGEYVVHGYLTQEDYANSVAAGAGDELGDFGTDIMNVLTESMGNMPYECKFNAATGDLTSMSIDMSSVLTGIIDMFKVLLGDDIGGELNGIGGSMTYTSVIVVDPTINVVIPDNLK